MFIVVCGVVAGVNLAVDGAVWVAVPLTAASVWVGWWMFPWRGGGGTHRHVRDLPADERVVVVYWRPGCRYCSRLKSELRHVRDRVHWINVWRDAEASRFVREANGGNEVVPTVVIDGVTVTNPDPADVRERLERAT